MYQISYNMSRKERCKQLISEITDAKNALCAAGTEKDVYKALKDLAVLFKMYDNYDLFPDIIEWVQETKKIINAVQMRDKTHSERVSLLDELLAKSNDIVDEEN